MSQTPDGRKFLKSQHLKSKIKLERGENNKKKRKEGMVALPSTRRQRNRIHPIQDPSNERDIEFESDRDNKQKNLSKFGHKQYRRSRMYRRHMSSTINQRCTSTPQGNVRKRPYSISISEIDTGSSEDNVNSKVQQQKISENVKKIIKEKKPTKKKRKRSMLQSEDVADEWESKSEESFNEFLNLQKDSRAENASMQINLFESPEKIRDAPIRFEESLLTSPIIQSSRSRKLRSISKDINIMQEDQLLPVHLPSADSPNLTDSTSQHDLEIHRETNVKVYPAARKSWESPEIKLGDYMYGPKVPTLVADQLWNAFIEKHYGKESHYLHLASPSAQGSAGRTHADPGPSNVSKESRNRFFPSKYRKRNPRELESSSARGSDTSYDEPGPSNVSKESKPRSFPSKCTKENPRELEASNAGRKLKHDIQCGKNKHGKRKRDKKQRNKEALKASEQNQRSDIHDLKGVGKRDLVFEFDGIIDNKRVSLAEFRCMQNATKPIVISSFSSQSDTE